eukprot:TRINITY_DN2235_c0_g2_i4.p1 TRINITY_DN2235_c0_g2~~TRINITY_DN2235_c0_g2_i4.p1  ORF type:complete len:1041 (+),score=143.10 TRINITY_DN2235_c0_g2_i4:312-3434(+)
MEWNQVNPGLKQVSRLDLSEPIGVPVDLERHSPMAMSQDQTLMAFHFIQGQIKIVKINVDGTLKHPFTLRLEEFPINDFCFVNEDAFKTKSPTLAILYPQDKLVHLKTYCINVEKKTIVEGAFSQNNVENAARKIAPAPSGIFIFGSQLISHLNPTSVRTIPITDFTTTENADTSQRHEDPVSFEDTSIVAWCAVDDTRFLLSNSSGKLYGLTITRKEKYELKLEALGYTSVPSTLSWTGIDPGTLYVGSGTGDSMLVQMLTSPNEEDQWINIQESYCNLGPIMDFAVVDAPSGSSQIVSCSGSGKDGSLRVIQKGIGFTEIASMDLAGVQGMWSLKGPNSIHERFVVLSFVGITKLLELQSDEVTETEANGFTTDTGSLWCADVQDRWIQITSHGINLVNPETRELAMSLDDFESNVTVGTSSGEWVACSISGALRTFQLKSKELVPKCGKDMGHEVSCLSISSNYCLAGLWDEHIVSILDVASLLEVGTVSTGLSLPRSVLLHDFGESQFLFCGLGDGGVITWSVEQATGGKLSMTDERKVNLGTQPVTLKAIKTTTQQTARGQKITETAVFVCSDKPAAFFSQKKRLQISHVNLGSVAMVSPFNTPSLLEQNENHLVVITTNSFAIGYINGIQKLDVRTYALGKGPTAITRHRPSGTYGVLCEEGKMKPNTVQLISGVNWESLASWKLDPEELALSISTVFFPDDGCEYLAVGTSYTGDEEEEPKSGRILIFKIYESSKLSLVAEKDVCGAVYKITEYNGCLLAAVNGTIQMYKWQEGGGLSLEAQQACHLTAISLNVKGDLILVGDLWRSVSLFCYKAVDSSFEEVAYDQKTRNGTLMDAVIEDDDTFLLADYTSLVTLSQSEDRRLVTSGKINLGNTVNVFRKGTLIHQEASTSHNVPHGHQYADPATTLPIDTSRSWIFGTVNGAFGIATPLSASQFAFLDTIQQAIINESIGTLEYQQWRTAKDRKCVELPFNYIDGEVIEMFVNIPSKQQETIVKKVNATLGEQKRKAGDSSPITITVQHLIDKLDQITRLL